MAIPDLTVIYEHFHHRENQRVYTKCCLIFGVFSTALVLIVVFALGIHKLEQHEIAFTHNKITTTISGPYDQGLHFFNPASEVIRFERTFQQKVIDVTCMTWDKMEFKATVSFQYLYREELIIPVVLKEFRDEQNYLVFLERNVTSNLISSCAEWNATDYYDQRAQVEKQMELNLIANLNGPNSRFGSDIKALQLKNIKFPDEFNEIIVRRQLIEQQRITTLNARPSLLTNANTTLLTAQKQAIIITTNSNNAARVILANANATAQVVLKNWQQLVASLVYAKQLNNWNNSQVINYLNQDTFVTKQALVDFSKYE